MRRSTIVYCGLLASLIFASGCGTTGRMNPMAWFRNGQSSRDAAGEKFASRNPFKRNANQTSEEAANGRQPEKDGEGKSGNRNADINQFIADELQDAAPRERAEMMADLASQDPQLVRQILRLRRMRIQLEQEKQQLAQNPVSDLDRPVQGLGTPYPGSTRRADIRNAIESGSISQVSSNVQQSQFDRRDFGHTRTDSGNRNAAFAENRAFATARQPPGLGNLPAAESYRARNPESTGRFIGKQAGNLADSGTGSAASEPSSPGVSSSRRPAVGSQRQLQMPTVPDEYSQYGDKATSNVRRANPLELPGIDTSPAIGQNRYNAFPASDRTHFGESHVPAVPVNSDMQRMIVVAEEQARESQVAWKQAEQIAPGNADDLSDREQAIAVRKQDYIEKQVHLRLLYLMSGQQARSLERIVGIEPADQEFWTQILWSMVNYFDIEGIPNQDERASETISQLRTAIQKLQENARLRIRNVNFCQKIVSYGNHETFASDKFRPKQAVLIYAEIENFASERRTDGMYRTQLKSTIEIRKGGQQGGEAIKTIDFEATTDLCRNHRQDYFHSYELQIPEGLQGNYVLVLIVEDQLSKRVTTHSRNFTVE